MVVRVVIAALTRGFHDTNAYATLIARNRSLSDVAICDQDLDVHHVLFHEGNISQEHQLYIADKTPSLNLKFVDVSEEFRYVPSDQGCKTGLCKETQGSARFSLGYKTMCRFWLHRFLDYTHDYDYVVRVDEDCVVKSLDLTSIIDDMRSSGKVYLTPSLMSEDSHDVVIGLARFSDRFAQEKGLAHPVYNQNPYTNVFVMNIEYFKCLALYQEYCKEVDKTGCIYINRWGDLPLWGVILSIMVPRDKWAVENRLVYYHGSHCNHINC